MDPIVLGFGLVAVLGLLVMLFRKEDGAFGKRKRSYGGKVSGGYGDFGAPTFNASNQPNLPVPPLRHPVLEYQYLSSRGTVPATLGDPIRPPPSVLGPSGGNLRAYNNLNPGPSVGMPVGVPVRVGMMKDDWYGGGGVGGYGMMGGKMGQPYFSSIFPDYVSGPGELINTPWIHVGVLQTTNPRESSILNLYQKAIAPNQNVFEYNVQDKNGFVIPLNNNRYIEDGDIINVVPGKESLGAWKANMYMKNAWVWR